MPAKDIIAFNREIIEKIREQIPQFGSRVGGSSEFVALRELQAEFALPYLFVVPVGRRALQNSMGGDTNLQTFRYMFSTIIAVDNSQRNKDTKSLTAMEQVEFILSKLLYVMIGRDPESAIQSDTIRFSDDFLHEMSNKVLWWQINWTFDYLVDSSDPELYSEWDDDFVPDHLVTRGFPNNATTDYDDPTDYNEKTEEGLYCGGDGVVDASDPTEPPEEE